MVHYRREARTLALQALCQLDVQGPDSLDELTDFLNEFSSDPAVILYAGQLVRQTHEHRQRYDELIARVALHWDIARMAITDRNIMRMALCEMLDRDEPPAKVAIDEAIELAKIFGTADSPQFVNGVLDAVLRSTAGSHGGVIPP
ncbi:MAG TPA: transcription antitermination factor NusB [Phycisphaerae bacterium]|nr:transcription antitermination factor NusB [Phycisphaerae bacterium]